MEWFLWEMPKNREGCPFENWAYLKSKIDLPLGRQSFHFWVVLALSKILIIC